MMLLHIWQIQSKGISYLNARRLCTSWTITQKSVTAWMSTNQHIYHNKRLRERFICFIRGAKWMKINRLNGPSTIHDGYFNIASLKYPIYDTCLLLIGYAKKSPLKVLQNSFPPLWFLTVSTSASQQAWRMRKCYHLLLSAAYEAKHVIFGNIFYENPSQGMKSLELFFCGHETQIWLDSRLTKCFAHGSWLTSARVWLMKWPNLLYL